MQSCCVIGCESYKHAKTMKIAYFKFPLNDPNLLSEWVKKIGYNNWQPSEQDQICSAHFENDDIDEQQNCISKFKYPCLKPNTVPTIFPLKRISLEIRGLPSSSIPNVTKFENNKQSNFVERQNHNSQFKSITLIPSQNQPKHTVSNQFFQLTPIVPNQIKYIISELPTPTKVHRPEDTSRCSNTIKLLPNNLILPRQNSPRSVLKLNLNKEQKILLTSGTSAPSLNQILPFIEILKNTSKIQKQFKRSNVINLQKSQLVGTSPTSAPISNVKKPTEPIILRKRKLHCTQTVTNKDITIGNESPTEKTIIPPNATVKLQSVSTRARENCSTLRKNVNPLDTRYQEEKQNVQKSEELNEEKQLEKLLKKRVLIPQDDRSNFQIIGIDESKNLRNDYSDGEIIGEIKEDVDYVFEGIDEESRNIPIVPDDKIDTKELIIEI